eukprot:CAMPEP_0185592628 /NCGR_PEP_ID=MMETSP0434-20130131/68561_1 /TAXON_ID=626734 ORGANISM="Favella taraikaensis, Strain Fe Narragansett Bay" /NCGR_SAMPLE_ID=MMETSP0434 /ASSEMBLY_ACC=CAM_ASM_000379 /LENGTH=59 /DNA_ID=CAMNT_0028218567 /DNA_START=481 /DNA_END=660 /DNA_ORIENTATION=+
MQVPQANGSRVVVSQRADPLHDSVGGGVSCANVGRNEDEDVEAPLAPHAEGKRGERLLE